jgi:hypothetical protein
VDLARRRQSWPDRPAACIRRSTRLRPTWKSCSSVAREFNGSDVDLGSEDVDGIATIGSRSYFSTGENFTTDGLSGKDEDTFTCEGSFAACDDESDFAEFFKGGLNGLSGNDVDAIEFVAP